MVNYTHDNAWERDFNLAIKMTSNSLKAFGLDEAQEAPDILAPELNDKGSVFHRLLEVFFDEARLDAELSFGAEASRHEELAYDDHSQVDDVRKANLKRFHAVLDDAILSCALSKDYGMSFKDSAMRLLDNSFPHQAFLFHLYETIMLQTRMLLMEEEGE